MDDLELPLAPEREILTVSALNRDARRLLESNFGVVWVEGEISNLARPSSGHMYWSLKDENAQVRCAMFRQSNRSLRFAPDNGQKVLARGRVSLYEVRGEFQLILDYVEEAGEGELRRRFEQLKRKLAAEGLFDLERKIELPLLPRRIGIVTSPSGAAVRDVITILHKRFPCIPVLIYPTRVQGEGAAEEIAEALELADRRGDCDVLILTRGGGSLEDLWPFNEEVVARAIAAVTTPLISAIGHEVDFTIADFVADARAPTPSGAAELAVPDQVEWFGTLNDMARRLSRAARMQLTDAQNAVGQLAHRLSRSNPGILLRESNQRLDDLELRLGLGWQRLLADRGARLARTTAVLRNVSPSRKLAALIQRRQWVQRSMARAMRELVAHRRARLEVTARALNAVGPLATLERGYAIVTTADNGTVLTNPRGVVAGTGIEVRLARGELSATVDESRPEDPDPNA